MTGLELKIPPDVVWVVVAAFMWLASPLTPRIAVETPIRIGLAGVLVVLGGGLIIAARVTLNRACTTWHPSRPDSASHLVMAGVFRYSRNPTYLGMLLILLGWAVLLGSPLTLALTVLFVVYLNRFQIRPEERALSAIFGREYDGYERRVRRWF
ncbi:MAG: isoprenylcysteine carboxylmethyltransferase family protein [Acidimicrobiia bacterium]